MAADQVLFEVRKNEKVGRYAVASQHLKRGDFILEEMPFAMGPKTDMPPICLSCYAPWEMSYLCSKCSWPVCNVDCENDEIHSTNECEVFAASKVKFQPIDDPSLLCPQLECITPLRVLLAKEKNPQRWEDEIKDMQTHTEERKLKEAWAFNQNNIVNYLRGPCKLDRFSEDLIHSVCGILEINTFESRTLNGYPIRCLYPKLAVLSHNCVSNITHSINYTNPKASDGFKVTVRATIDINEGEELFSCYTYSLWPTLVRREFLKESKYFDCICERCADPKELDTHMGTLKCTKCDNGVILSTNPLDSTADWSCTHCDFKTSSVAVRKIFAVIQEDVDAVDAMEPCSAAAEAREQLSRKYKSILHPRNAYHLLIQCGLSQLYGKVDGYSLNNLPDVLLERKIEMCQRLLQTLDVVEPGCTRMRGLILYELHAPLILLAKSLNHFGSLTKDELKTKLEEAMKVLQESVEILSLEPEGTIEGMLGNVAKESMVQFKANLLDLIELA